MVVFPSITTLLISLQFFPILTFSPITQLGPITVDGSIFDFNETIDDEWLILIYIKDNSPDKGIIIEDKSNEEKNLSYEYKPSEIFKASDMMVDSLTQLIARKRSKKN